MRTPLICFCCLTLAFAGVAQVQTTTGDEHLILYHVDSTHGGYILCRNFESFEKRKTSNVVIGDTFAIQTTGAVCMLVMSNAYLLQTTLPNSASNQVAQIKMHLDVYKMPFPIQTKVFFNSSIVELSQLKIEVPNNQNVTFERDDALRQLGKMGLKPPDDMDRAKAVDRKTGK